VQSAVLLLRVVRPSVLCPSVCNVGGGHPPIVPGEHGEVWGEYRWGGKKWPAGGQKRQYP